MNYVLKFNSFEQKAQTLLYVQEVIEPDDIIHYHTELKLSFYCGFPLSKARVEELKRCSISYTESRM